MVLYKAEVLHISCTIYVLLYYVFSDKECEICVTIWGGSGIVNVCFVNYAYGV